MIRRALSLPGAATALLALSTACAVGPNYKRPEAPLSPEFKEIAAAAEATAGQWKPSEPRDAAIRGKWWEIYGDPVLNSLEDQVDVSNLTIAQAEAQFRSARAGVRSARADFFPSLTTSPGVTRAQASANRVTGSTSPVTVYSLPVDFSWELDVFGRIRRSVEANVGLAQASAADLESVRLAMHAELAADYFELRGLDAQKQILDSNADAYAKALQLTVNRHNQGVVSGVDVAQAETQLYTVQAQATDLASQRAQFEHAIAVLIGKPPALLTIEATTAIPVPPPIPVVIPSELLERRPEIAASERRVAAANAQIGVATAAFFPRLLLEAAGGYQGGRLADWFTLPARFWSIGPTILQTIFDGGRRKAIKQQTEAAYDASVAIYRLDVLTAFQQVEDNLSSLRLLSIEAAQQRQSLDAANRYLELARSRYEGGITSYLEVTTAQTVALLNARVEVDLLTRQMTASVNLIKALGGGWTTSELPAASDLVWGHAEARQTPTQTQPASETKPAPQK